MRRGDIYSVNLDPTVGNEQKGRRPVVIVSPDDYNKVFAPLVCPITSGGQFDPNRGVAVPLAGGKVTGVVLCNQMRTVDLKARKARKIQAIDPEVLQEVLWAIQDIVAD
jgi:mRNA interferase ChpB